MVSNFDESLVEGELSEYRVGSILYIYMENFVTYTKCSLYPGPHVNMLMGPNGSGKSSVVAALVIGLGWPPSLLGRSKDVGEYVKYGSGKAVIEIALRFTGDLSVVLQEEVYTHFDGYVVVKREVKRNRGTGRTQTEWNLNGRNCTQKSVNTLVKHLNVQVDNLCQFLPQDKVSEFAKLSPSDLLLETEKATNNNENINESLYGQHLKLIELRGEERQLHGVKEEQEKSITSLKMQNEAVEGVMARMEARQSLQDRIRMLEAKRPWLQYNSAREEYMERREERDGLRKDLQVAEASTDPLKRELRVAEEDLRQVQSKISESNKEVEGIKKNIEIILREKIERIRGEIVKGKMQILKEREQKAKKEATIMELQKMIRQLEQEVSRGGNNLDERGLGEINREMEGLMDQIQEAEGEVEVADEACRSIGREGDRLTSEIDVCNVELRRMEDGKMQRLEAVRRLSADVAQVYNWLQDESVKSIFKNQVYGPICMEMEVKDAQVARHVESLVSRSVFLQFIVTCQEDYEAFYEQVIDSNMGKVSVILLEDHQIGKEVQQAKERLEGLKRIGFEGSVLDVIEAPVPVMAALIDVCKVHIMPLSKKRVEGDLIESKLPFVQKYATQDGFFELRRSRYNKGEVAVKCTPLKPAVFFYAGSAAMERKLEIQQRIGDRRSKLAANQERMKVLLRDQEGIRSNLVRLKDKREELSSAKREFIYKVNEQRKRVQLLELKRGNLSKLMADVPRSREEENALKAELVKLFKEHAETTLHLCGLLQRQKDICFTLVEQSVVILTAESKVNNLQEQITAANSQHSSLRMELSKCEESLSSAKSRAKELLEIASRQPLDEETKEYFTHLPETLMELERVLATERAQLEVSEDSNVSGRTRRDYEERVLRIIKLEETLAKTVNRIAIISEQIDLIHSIWLPKVQSMVDSINERFSNLFTMMSCVGQVQISPMGRDYAGWSLQLLVKFRDNENLQILSATRQSGGEKSVSTILYLLALQDHSSAPFRLVDEINQGMDASNERRVHAMIVETATHNQGGGGSQYFLITPKLLTGLHYHDKMHVLCVYSGVGVPVL